MSTLMPKDTAALLGQNAQACKSRSLFMDRFADPAAQDSGESQPRRNWFNALCKMEPERVICQSRSEWTKVLAKGNILYAQLQSRLMINMAGGVMENAGLCLDRFGLPYIPGSAVKGCARRMALFALREWCESGVKPVGVDNPCAKACTGFEKPADMLAAIALIFGWGDTEWKDGRKSGRNGKKGELYSDFEFACGENESWHAVRPIVAKSLLNQLGVKECRHPEQPWEDLPNFAGCAAFLPAYPVDLGKTGKVDGLPAEVPELGKIELDVVTCHHSAYYRGEKSAATDDDKLNPVIFPAVAPGHVFAFALVPLRNCSNVHLEYARRWLADGLQTFGLGAKTNAGYGWFQDSTNAVSKHLTRVSRKANEEFLIEFRAWTDKQIRAAARPFMFQSELMWPKTGRETTEDYGFTLVWFILNEKKALFEAEKHHAGSDFAKWSVS